MPIMQLHLCIVNSIDVHDRTYALTIRDPQADWSLPHYLLGELLLVELVVYYFSRHYNTHALRYRRDLNELPLSLTDIFPSDKTFSETLSLLAEKGLGCLKATGDITDKSYWVILSGMQEYCDDARCAGVLRIISDDTGVYLLAEATEDAAMSAAICTGVNRLLGLLQQQPNIAPVHLEDGPFAGHGKAVKTFLEMFCRTARDFPDNTAVIGADLLLTYRQLDTLSSQIATVLPQHGVGPGARLAVLMNRSASLLPVLIGIMKAGAIFTPLDPLYPQERLRYILRKGNIAFIVQDASLKDLLPETQHIRVLDTAQLLNEAAVCTVVARETVQRLTDIVYEIYTSGSSGAPKGVAVMHGGLGNLLESVGHRLHLKAEDRMVALTSVCFDIAYMELFLPLTCGACVLLMERAIAKDPFLLAEKLHSSAATFMQATPATWQMLVDSGWRNETGITILSGGEAISQKLVSALCTLNGRENTVWNLYGPTETTIWSLASPLSANTEVTIGSPLANTFIYVAKENNEPALPGEEGVLYIGGSGVAKGYVNDDLLTEEVFVKDLFVPGGSPFYNTGDWVRLTENNGLIYLGRKDNQIKVRGFRIELEEIDKMAASEDVLASFCTVCSKTFDGENQLIAYYALRPDYLEKAARAQFSTQVEGWQGVYEDQYASPSDVRTTDDIDVNIWNDSFTGGKIPPEHIQEWLADITDIVRSGGARSVLEIGCGTGLVYFGISGFIDHYTGTDFSASSIKQIASLMTRKGAVFPDTRLFVCAAHETPIDDASFDTVIINSVIQYFPDEVYLDDVMRRSVKAIKGAGRVIVGDVRDNRLLAAFKSRMLLDRINPDMDLNEFQWNVSQEVLKDEQLSISPEYFYDLKRQYEEITAVEILLKRGEYINEMSLYRYNVILYIRSDRPVHDPVWYSFSELSCKDLDNFFLTDPVVAIRDVPNEKLLQDTFIKNACSNISSFTTGELRRKLTELSPPAILQHLIQAAAGKRYHVKKMVHPDPMKYNLVFEKDGVVCHTVNYFPLHSSPSRNNIPYMPAVYQAVEERIRQILHSRLPDYMVPLRFVPVQALPLTSNGKTDRKFLSGITSRNYLKSGIGITENFSVTETLLHEIWKQVLHLDHIGPNDNFFQLGGHSLTAMRAIAMIRKQTGKQIQVGDFFIYATIRTMATLLDSFTGDQTDISPVDNRGNTPLSYFQEAIWQRDKEEGTVKIYIPFRVTFKGKPDAQALEKAFNLLITRHSVLRSVIREEGASVYQELLPENTWRFSQPDNGSITDRLVLEEYIREYISQPFDPRKEHLIKAVLLEPSATENILVMVLHPLVGDGWSISILVNDLACYYNNLTAGASEIPTPLQYQYGDFAAWQQAYLSGERLAQKEGFWRNLLKDYAPNHLPYKEEPGQERVGKWYHFSFSAEQWREIEAFANKSLVTPFMLTLTAYSVLLAGYNNWKPICIGLPIANRMRQEQEQLIGYFANTLPLMLTLVPGESLQQNLARVKNTMLQIYQHQEIPLEMINNLVWRDKKSVSEQLFKVTFEFNNMPVIPYTLGLAGIDSELREIGQPLMDRELRFSITIIQGVCYVGIKYRMDLFEEATIRDIAAQYTTVLRLLMVNPELLAGSLPPVTFNVL